MALTLSPSLVEAIHAHGRETYPNECCGALIGCDGAVVETLALPNMTEEGPRRRFLVRPGDYRAASEIARDAARYGYRIDRTSVTRVFEETLAEAARLVVARPEPEHVRSAHALIALGRELGLDANLERGQEILYEAAAKGRPLPAEAREFALALGLAPQALAPAGPALLVNG